MDEQMGSCTKKISPRRAVLLLVMGVVFLWVLDGAVPTSSSSSQSSSPSPSTSEPVQIAASAASTSSLPSVPDLDAPLSQAASPSSPSSSPSSWWERAKTQLLGGRPSSAAAQKKSANVEEETTAQAPGPPPARGGGAEGGVRVKGRGASHKGAAGAAAKSVSLQTPFGCLTIRAGHIGPPPSPPGSSASSSSPLNAASSSPSSPASSPSSSSYAASSQPPLRVGVLLVGYMRTYTTTAPALRRHLLAPNRAALYIVTKQPIGFHWDENIKTAAENIPSGDVPELAVEEGDEDTTSGRQGGSSSGSSSSSAKSMPATPQNTKRTSTAAAAAAAASPPPPSPPSPRRLLPLSSSTAFYGKHLVATYVLHETRSVQYANPPRRVCRSHLRHIFSQQFMNFKAVQMAAALTEAPLWFDDTSDNEDKDVATTATTTNATANDVKSSHPNQKGSSLSSALSSSSTVVLPHTGRSFSRKVWGYHDLLVRIRPDHYVMAPVYFTAAATAAITVPVHSIIATTAPPSSPSSSTSVVTPVLDQQQEQHQGPQQGWSLARQQQPSLLEAYSIRMRHCEGRQYNATVSARVVLAPPCHPLYCYPLPTDHIFISTANVITQHLSLFKVMLDGDFVALVKWYRHRHRRLQLQQQQLPGGSGETTRGSSSGEPFVITKPPPFRFTFWGGGGGGGGGRAGKGGKRHRGGGSGGTSPSTQRSEADVGGEEDAVAIAAAAADRAPSTATDADAARAVSAGRTPAKKSEAVTSSAHREEGDATKMRRDKAATSRDNTNNADSIHNPHFPFCVSAAACMATVQRQPKEHSGAHYKDTAAAAAAKAAAPPEMPCLTKDEPSLPRRAFLKHFSINGGKSIIHQEATQDEYRRRHTHLALTDRLFGFMYLLRDPVSVAHLREDFRVNTSVFGELFYRAGPPQPPARRCPPPNVAAFDAPLQPFLKGVTYSSSPDNDDDELNEDVPI